ncbi:MAG: hypothetical protein GYB65_10510, partial [Chloroflexi bacterium]|nr:hypothetical protein [Chloroflexota bacterium]
NYAQAERAYSRGLAWDATTLKQHPKREPFYALYALRAEARQQLSSTDGADGGTLERSSMADLDVVRQGSQGDIYVPLFLAALAGNWTCDTFFEFDYSTLGDDNEQP